MRFLYAITFVACLFVGAASPADPPLARLPDGAIRRLGTADLRTGGETGEGPHGGFAISPDGKQAATVKANFVDATLQVWDLATGRLVCSVELPKPPRTRPGGVYPPRGLPADNTFSSYRLAWSPDGKFLVIPRNGSVYRYAVPVDGQPITLPAIDENTGLSTVGFGRAGNELYAISTRGEFVEFRPKTSEWVRHEMPELARKGARGPGTYTNYSLSSGKGVVAFGGGDGRIRLWSPEKKELLGTLDLDGSVEGLQVSADGTRVVARGSGTKSDALKDRVVVWSLPDQKRVLPEKSDLGIYAKVLALSPDGSLLALDDDVSSKKAVVVHDAKTGKKLHTMPVVGDELRHLTFSPDGSQVLALGTEGVIHRWDVKTGKPIDAEVGHRGELRATLVLPDGRTLTGAWDGVICLWDADGKEVRRFTGLGGPVFALALSPDGTILYASSILRAIRAWNLADGTVVHARQFGYKPEDDGIESMAVSPDGKTLALGFWEGVRLFDSKTLKESGKLAVPKPAKDSIAIENRIRDMRFLADGRLITSNLRGTLRVWDVGKQAVTRTLDLEVAQHSRSKGERSVHAFAVSPDGKTVAAPLYPKEFRQNQLVFIGFRDLATGKELGRAEVTYKTQLSAITYTTDGKSVLVGDERKGRIFQLDVESKKVTRTFNSGRHFPRCLAVYPDGKAFVSGGTDATALVWKLDTK